MAEEERSAAAKHERVGVLAGVAAFVLWGLFPIYFIWLKQVDALEMLAHRVIWAVPFGALILTLRRQWPAVRGAVAKRQTLALLSLSSLFIAVNWLGYIWAVQGDQIYQASLGYYINPLMYVLAGFLLLGERLRPMQLAAVGLATIGVTILAAAGGRFPGLAILVAFSFTMYGVIRKRAEVGAMPGLFVETLLLAPICLGYLSWLIASGRAAFDPSSPVTFSLLLLAGPITVIPLVLFAVAARRLSLSTIGFLQFIAPTGQFLIGLANGEPLTAAHVFCFAFIWTAVTIFVMDAWKHARSAAFIA